MEFSDENGNNNLDVDIEEREAASTNVKKMSIKKAKNEGHNEGGHMS